MHTAQHQRTQTGLTLTLPGRAPARPQQAGRGRFQLLLALERLSGARGDKVSLLQPLRCAPAPAAIPALTLWSGSRSPSCAACALRQRNGEAQGAGLRVKAMRVAQVGPPEAHSSPLALCQLKGKLRQHPWSSRERSQSEQSRAVPRVHHDPISGSVPSGRNSTRPLLKTLQGI